MSKVTVLHVEHYQHEATARGHSVLLDEPVDQGGDDRGMNPYEHLLAALGGCTAMTGDLDEEQRARLLEIASRCPVHRTLEGTIEILDEA